MLAHPDLKRMEFQAPLGMVLAVALLVKAHPPPESAGMHQAPDMALWMGAFSDHSAPWSEVITASGSTPHNYRSPHMLLAVNAPRWTGR